MSDPEQMLNKKIGRYEIKELIGEGAMAMVYRAFDPEINRSVACKILKAEHCVDEEYTSRFLREAKAAGRLSHSSIVTVYDVGKIEGSPYIMMELIEGSDLGIILDKKHKLSLKQSLTIALHLAKALDYAHSTNIVHRDIKPDNIILLQDNESIKVADFGIARISENEEAQKTQVGSVLGTPRYMSPEQALGNEVDGRSDLFSVGSILYEMLTGNKAFDAQNMGTLMMQISQHQPTEMKKLSPEVPVGVRQIVNKLLQKSPDKRFQNGAALATAIIRELSALQEQSDEQKQHKYIPLKYKFTLFAVAIVSLVLAISMNIIYNKQAAVMTNASVDSGSSFAKFIATETAIPLLSEDWITLETFINDAASRDTFAYLIVTDRDGLIRGASDPSLVGQSYMEDKSATFINKTNDVYTTSSMIEDKSDVFNIATPILFQNTEVGQIILGLSQQSLEEVKSTTAWLMFFLALITLSSVALIMFIFGGLISKPLKSITKNLVRLEEGDLDARISLARSDEIGRVIIAFNDMASSIQKRYTKVADELAQSGIQMGPLGDENDSTVIDTSISNTTNENADNTSTHEEFAQAKSAGDAAGEEVDEATIMASSLISRRDEVVDDATIIAEAPSARETENDDSATENDESEDDKAEDDTEDEANTEQAKARIDPPIDEITKETEDEASNNIGEEADEEASEEASVEAGEKQGDDQKIPLNNDKKSE